MYKIKNYIFFAGYLLLNPYLIKLALIHKIYLPVYVQFEWLKQYSIGTIVDVGANIGRVSRVLNHIFPTALLFAFEPNKELIPQISKRIKSKKLTIETVALTDKVGQITLQTYPNSALSSTLAFTNLGEKDRNPTHTNAKKIPVETTTLDHYFQTKKLQGNILLKIDTEGAEGIILKGGKKFIKKVAIIHLETYFDKFFENQLFE